MAGPGGAHIMQSHQPQPHMKNCTPMMGVNANARLPPAYNVAAQRALMHRLGRAHSHEGVTSSISISPAPPSSYYPPNAAMMNVAGTALTTELDVDDNGKWPPRLRNYPSLASHCFHSLSLHFRRRRCTSFGCLDVRKPKQKYEFIEMQDV